MANSGGEFGSGPIDGRKKGNLSEPQKQLPERKKEILPGVQPRIFEKFDKDPEREGQEEPTIIKGEVLRRYDEPTTQPHGEDIFLNYIRGKRAEEQYPEIPDITSLTGEDLWRDIADGIMPPEAHEDVGNSVQGFFDERLRQVLEQPERLSFLQQSRITEEETHPEETQAPHGADITADEAFGPDYWSKVDNPQTTGINPDAMEALSRYHAERNGTTEGETETPER